MWVATDQIDGDTAASLLRSEYPDGLSRDETVEIVTAIGEALDYAHARGVVHAGVAPDNIVLAGSGPRRRILLTNFVVSRLVADDAGPAAITADSVTYTAPERLTGQPADGRADQYALAGTAFHLLTGRPPFAHTNPAVVISGHLSTPPPRLSATRTDLDDLDAALARALAKDPDDRYDTCLDFAAALTGAAAAVPPQPAATWPADRAMPVPEAAVGEPPSVAHTAVDSAPPVIISSWGKDKLPRARAATAPKSTSPPGPSPTQKKSRTPAAARTQAAATSDATRRWETNFWIEVGIDPIRIVLDSESLFTWR
ncbi:MAG TPA: protein kinase, partial [Mycobacterium sp.]